MRKADQLLLVRWRLSILAYASEVKNVSRACRHFGVSRTLFYRWKRRYEEFGEVGLCDRSPAPEWDNDWAFRDLRFTRPDGGSRQHLGRTTAHDVRELRARSSGVTP